MILARPKSFQYADNIAVVLSALVKTGYEDAALMQRLSVYTQELSPSRHALSPASAAKILHAFAVTRTRDLQLIAFISARLQDSVRPAARDGGGGLPMAPGNTHLGGVVPTADADEIRNTGGKTLAVPEVQIAPLLKILIPHPQQTGVLLIPGIAYGSMAGQAGAVINQSMDGLDRGKLQNGHEKAPVFG